MDKTVFRKSGLPTFIIVDHMDVIPRYEYAMTHFCPCLQEMAWGFSQYFLDAKSKVFVWFAGPNVALLADAGGLVMGTNNCKLPDGVGVEEFAVFVG